MSADKESRNLRVEVSDGWPRWIKITQKASDDVLHNLSIEDARDLCYMLKRILALVEEDDTAK